MLFHLRDAFRAGDVWLARSRRYGDIRRTLLTIPAVPDADRSLPVPASSRDWLSERQCAWPTVFNGRGSNVDDLRASVAREVP